MLLFTITDITATSVETAATVAAAANTEQPKQRPGEHQYQRQRRQELHLVGSAEKPDATQLKNQAEQLTGWLIGRLMHWHTFSTVDCIVLTLGRAQIMCGAPGLWGPEIRTDT